MNDRNRRIVIHLHPYTYKQVEEYCDDAGIPMDEYCKDILINELTYHGVVDEYAK